MDTRLQALGSRLLVVSPNKAPLFPGRPHQLEHHISLELDDAVAVARQMPQVQAVVPLAARESILRFGSQASRIRLVGTQPDYLALRGFKLAEGRFLLPADQGQRVIVLGHSISRDLDPAGVRPGDTVSLSGQPYEVVGIFEPQGVNSAGEDEDHQAFIPLDTYQKKIANRLWLSHLYLHLTPQADVTKTAQQVLRLLRERHNRSTDQADDVIVRDMTDIAAARSSLLGAALWVVSATSGFLLLLGVAGIATLMLQVVRQRRAEIGLRRALGATPLAVGLQFFLEGIILSTTGVFAGLFLGLVATLLGGRLVGFPFALSLTVLSFAVLFSLAAGGLACLLPALAAGRLEPALALRSQL
jgi:putative ABC transport system permease protein